MKQKIVEKIKAILTVQPLHVFIFFGVIYGIAFTILIPPFQVSDEENHYLRVYQLSEGQIKGIVVYNAENTPVTNVLSPFIHEDAGIYAPRHIADMLHELFAVNMYMEKTSPGSK